MALPENKCPSCGTDLPAGLSPDRCPKCLLRAGLGPGPAAGPGGTVVVPASALISRGLPQPGEEFGHYAIMRLLGAGGMGAVYEAEDEENGRRVALKVLSHTLDSPEARERFLREGRLAASINHPNSVYVFGTEEIGGTPVITMELMPGGTLEESVRGRGPMKISEAVECVLQLIAGLEAAQRTGILHRDIKPSNCFLADDRTVKIGDFGLSISTTIRTEPALTATGAFLGTPAFCSPEQLRGDELNARSDLYSVGATLFYLLTGRTPFEAQDMVRLLATVLEQPAPSPRKYRADIPRGLAKAVLRCLEKQPGERFKSYAELAQALVPYCAAAPTPATLGLRFLAGVMDSAILGVISTSMVSVILGTPFDMLELMAERSPKLLGWAACWFSGFVLYYAVSEWRWGATVGKALCRLLVVGPSNGPPVFWRASIRATVYIAVPVVPYWAVYGFSTPALYMGGSRTSQLLLGASFYVLLALLFSTARRRNGFAALHDLITGTRVISKTALQARPALAGSEPPPRALGSTPTLGPYHILETMEKTDGACWLLGFDMRLLRKVWLHQLPSGTPQLPAPMRNLGRVGRLRWLTGRRSGEENWDAFEALSGKPLLELVERPQSWDQVRFWVHDLATELATAQKDGTIPVLALDRVWITQDGRAKLLDFPAPGLGMAQRCAGELLALSGTGGGTTPPPVLPPNAACPVLPPVGSQFLDRVISVALEGAVSVPPKPAAEAAVPLPLHAREFLRRLPHLTGAQAVAGALKPLLGRVASVSPARRGAVLAGCIAFPLFLSLAMLFGMSVSQRWTRSHPGLMELSQVLQVRYGTRFWPRKIQPPKDALWQVYIASHCRPTITNQTTWKSVLSLMLIKDQDRKFAEQSVTNYPAPSPEQIAEADAALARFLPRREVFDLRRQPWMPAAVLAMLLAAFVGVPALLAALLFRGGLMLRVAGVAFVRRDGRRASRLRVFWRALIAWGSLLAGVILYRALKSPLGPLNAGLVAWLLSASLAVISVLLPTRGLPDRFAGTWPVPR